MNTTNILLAVILFTLVSILIGIIAHPVIGVLAWFLGVSQIKTIFNTKG